MHSILQIVLIVIIVLLLPFIFCLLDLWFPQWSPYPIFWATLISEVSLICTAIVLCRLNRIIKSVEEYLSNVNRKNDRCDRK